MAIALLLHVPFVPSPLGMWLRMALLGEPADYDDPAQAVIPIDLDLLAEAPNAEAAATPPPSPGADATKSAPPPRPEGEVPALADAGAPRDAAADAAPTDAGRPDAAPASSASASADAGPPPLRDPVSAAGGAGKISAKDPNVQVLIAGNVIRKHELGAAFSRILLLIPQWRPFFEGSPLDPIRDVNHLLLTAPRLRSDTSKMVVTMDFNAPEPVIRAAVDNLVQRANGAWLEDSPIPAARARIGDADRLLALVPGKKLLVIMPPEAEDQLASLKQSKGFRNSTVGIVISMLTPGRPFKGVFPVPETLKWMRVAVTPTDDGGADVAVEAGDKSPEDAQKHAPELTRAFDQVRTIDMVLTRINVLDHAEFVAVGDVLRAQVHVTVRQLKLILGFVEQRLREQAAQMGGAAPAGAASPGTIATPAPAPSPMPAPRPTPAPTAPAPKANP